MAAHMARRDAAATERGMAARGKAWCSDGILRQCVVVTFGKAVST